MQITRTEPDSGGANRTPREEIRPLVTGTRKVNPEALVDCSPSEAYPWAYKKTNTWTIQMMSLKGFTEPFAMLDSQAGHEAESAGGVEMWPFSDRYLQLSDKKDEDGKLIIDVNPSNFDERLTYFVKLHRDHFDKHGLPQYGGTEIMQAVKASDEHFMADEFGELPKDQRPLRVRTVFSDGALQDKKLFIAYLSNATPVTDPRVSPVTVIGRHGEWDEIWVIAIFGEEGGGGHAAYQEYVELAKTHPWIYPLYFENVTNSAEAAEDLALTGVPTQA